MADVQLYCSDCIEPVKTLGETKVSLVLYGDADALAHIKRLEREKNALLRIIKTTDVACGHCKWYVEETHDCNAPDVHMAPYDCHDCPFEWRGVKEENDE